MVELLEGLRDGYRYVLRDHRRYEALERMGWTSLVIWECETTDAERLAARLRWFLDGEPVT